MEKNLELALINVIEKTTSGVEQGVKFLSEQTPDIINQLLLYKMCFYTIVPVVFITLSVVFWGIFFKNIKDTEYNTEYNTKQEVICIFTGILGFITTMASLFSMNLKWLQIIIAPKLYLIEYAAELIKQ